MYVFMYVCMYRYDVIRDRFGQDISDARMDEEEVSSEDIYDKYSSPT